MPTADLIISNIGELVTCRPSLGHEPLGIIPRAAIAAAGERILWGQVIKRGQTVWET